MEKIDAKLLGMVSVTLLTRLTAHMERNGALPLGWTAGELRQAAAAAENNILHGADPEFHHAFAKALCRIADLSLQSISEDGAEEPPAPTLHSVGPEDESRGGHEAPGGPGPTVPGTGPKNTAPDA
ncbi:hypothetical protein [Neoroseomonas lacus]|uniref:Uncharacterized protein n=1 Tax=Neoroseomonas lacus TaxID=287609 RepID=A0A917KSW7_9PROT|nr:hypothetical protein [Neoroseomonas lacus]GGJ28350.1 hypothetical protein GCM10011320_39580 [Neoroseomonas lacus]